MITRSTVLSFPRRLVSVLISVLPLAAGTGAIALSDAFCPAIAWAQTADFGQSGQNGFDGREGRPGRSGGERSLRADGTDQRLELAGEAGGAGEDGDNGRSALCSPQPRQSNRSLRAASGGRGGNGGNGGSGGNGGDLTVYFSNPTDLRRIFVNAAGGEGGRGGRGGYGGRGCACDFPQWQNQVCSGTPGSPNYRCTTQVYTCTDGRTGNPGQGGSNGRPGRLGILSIVNQPQPLASEVPALTDTISNLVTRPVSLSKNLWTRRRGAAALLAPGSIIADEYREFAGRIEESFQLDWGATRSPQDFASAALTLQLQDDRQIAVVSPPEVWLAGTATRQEQQTTYRVTAVVRREEATRLAVADVSGRGNALQLAIVDLAGRSDVVSTQFRLRLQVDESGGDRAPDFRTVFNDAIPADLVSREANRFTLSLGRLPISGRSLATGTAVRMEVTAVRSLGGRSAEQEIQWRGTLRR